MGRLPCDDSPRPSPGSGACTLISMFQGMRNSPSRSRLSVVLHSPPNEVQGNREKGWERWKRGERMRERGKEGKRGRRGKRKKG